MSIVILLAIVLVIVLSLFFQENSNKNKEDNMVLKLIYTFLIGIFLAVFVGVGIAAFYSGPKRPEAPASIKYAFSETDKKEALSAEYKAEIEKYDQAEKEYQLQSQTYNKNVSIYSLIASILIVITSLTLFKNILFIADGLLLGGVLTLLYSVIRGFDTQDNMFRFIVVSIGLFISLFLGYTKFIKPTKTTRP